MSASHNPIIHAYNNYEILHSTYSRICTKRNLLKVALRVGCDKLTAAQHAEFAHHVRAPIEVFFLADHIIKMFMEEKHVDNAPYLLAKMSIELDKLVILTTNMRRELDKRAEVVYAYLI